MGRPRVSILYGTPLFARGLEHLLREGAEVEVVGVGLRGRQALRAIRALKPDVILVETGKGMPKPCLLISRLLQEQYQAWVVQVSLGDNTAALYTGRRWTANGVEDLLRGIFDPMVLQVG